MGVMDLAYSPDGKLLAVAGGGSESQAPRLCLLDPVTGKEAAKLEGHTSPIAQIAFSPDGKTLASGSGDSTIVLWDLSGAPPNRASRTPRK